MADDVTLPGTGAVIATDDVGGRQFQVVKLAVGGSGVAQELSEAAPLPVAGTFWQATQPVSFTWAGLTDAQLRASAVPVSAAALPLPAGAATEGTLTAIAAAVKAEDSAHVSGDFGVPLLALRQSTDSVSTSDDGDYANLKTDEEGRLKVATKPASFDAVTGNVTAVNGVVVADVRRASNVVFHVKNTGSVTLAAGTFVFEASIDSTNGTDGTWFTVQAIRTSANTIETSIALSGIAAAAGYASAWEASVNAYAWFRLRCSVAVTASAIASWTIQRGSYATEPIPAAQISGTQPVSGTVTANQGTWATPTASILNSTASTNGTVVKASAGTLYNITASNTNAAVRYLKLYNSATVTVGTTTVALTIPIPAGGTVTVPFGALGMRFGTGICISTTTGAADNDTGAVAAGEVKVLTSFI